MRTPTPSAVGRLAKKIITRTVILAIATIAIFLTSDLAVPQAATAYPFWAQATAPETPREATGRIVCANCHLASKPTEIEINRPTLINGGVYDFFYIRAVSVQYFVPFLIRRITK